MLRREARLRREYLYKKQKEVYRNKTRLKQDKINKNLQNDTYIHGSLQSTALKLQERTKYDTDQNVTETIDDEYRYAGSKNPKIMITTSHNPSARLKVFAKELRLIFPNAQRLNRGKYELRQLVHACQANDVTDFIVIHEHRGVPDNLVVCHLPFGPTAFFNISSVVMRHDIPNIGKMSEQYPHLVFHNFKTTLGERAAQILKHLFPVAKSNSQRVVTFANHDDYISFRHHTFQYINKELELKEVGPRFQLKLYQIKLGTLDKLNGANTEWILRPYMNTASKQRFLSNDDGWDQNEEE
ncbi:U3 small nucleolar ribonucleoprotein protein IMP4 [Teleopsis dalmanni]|uniref:U3 small nucleolar ribonucleoprotein protein IMP4 n=1 Tax=Teleopsis dalmanni TaxID=139649 RepID=UPI0018CC82C5|nr:U3 small nucleolar ribonucleoprotein protein IMP4 [Teleopsis dalmanni]